MLNKCIPVGWNQLRSPVRSNPINIHLKLQLILILTDQQLINLNTFTNYSLYINQLQLLYIATFVECSHSRQSSVVHQFLLCIVYFVCCFCLLVHTNFSEQILCHLLHQHFTTGISTVMLLLLNFNAARTLICNILQCTLNQGSCYTEIDFQMMHAKHY